MPGREGEKERGREGGLARWNEPTLSRVAFEFFNVIQRGELSSLLRRGALEKKNLGIYKTYPFLSTFGRKFVRSFRRSSRDTIENRKRDVILKREISK